MDEGLSLCPEELVEVEAIHVPLLNHRAEVLRHLVGHHHHGGHLQVGTAHGLFPCLLVLIGPVEDLAFHELARGEGTERGAAEVEVVLARDGHIAVIPGAPAFHVNTAFTHHLILFGLPFLGLGIPKVEQTFGVVVPRAEVVLVQHNQIPMDAVNPLVLGLDVSVAVSAEVVLERAEHHKRLWR